VRATRAIRLGCLALWVSACESDADAVQRIETEAREAIAIGADASQVEQALKRLGFMYSWDTPSHQYLASKRVPGAWRRIKQIVLLKVRMDDAGRVQTTETLVGRLELVESPPSSR